MIKREYFVRAKISHDDGTGLYSWWSGTIIIETLFRPKGHEVFDIAMEIAGEKIRDFEGGGFTGGKVQIESLNRL